MYVKTMDNANANVTAASIPVLIFEAKASFIQSFLLAFGTNLLKNINITIVGTHDSSIVPKVMTISFLDNKYMPPVSNIPNQKTI